MYLNLLKFSGVVSYLSASNHVAKVLLYPEYLLAFISSHNVENLVERIIIGKCAFESILVQCSTASLYDLYSGTHA